MRWRSFHFEFNSFQIKPLSSMTPGLDAFIVQGGGILSSAVRRAICDEAKGSSDDYIASSVHHDDSNSKRWTDSIKHLKNLTDEQYHTINESLNLSHNDAIFVSQRPDSLTVLTLHTDTTDERTGRFNHPRPRKITCNPTSSQK